MNAVLRITLTYFSIVPLQKWLTIAGVLLIAGALLFQPPLYGAYLILGTFFVVFIPVLMGGTAMRFGSSRSTLQLRPGAHWKMLAAALLTILVITGIGVLSMWMAPHAGLDPPRQGANILPLGDLALAMWGGYSLVWLLSFIASASRLWAMSICIGFVAMASQRWAPLNAFGSTPHVLAGTAAVAWMAFAFWYLNARQVRHPGWTSSASPMGMGEKNTGGWYSALTESRNDSRAVAIKAYLLGTTSQVGFLLPGIISALVILPFYFVQRKASGGLIMLPVTFLTIFSGIAGGMSYMVARRARMLWLRAGLDRAGLFALGERTSLLAFSQMVLSGAIVLGVFSIVVKPEMTDRILVYVGTQLAYATVAFYFGLSQTRAWSATSIAGSVLIGLGMIFQMILLLPQTTGVPPVVAPVLFGISVLLALLLRQHARKRWLTLDWHLTRPPVVQRQTL